MLAMCFVSGRPLLLAKSSRWLGWSLLALGNAPTESDVVHTAVDGATTDEEADFPAEADADNAPTEADAPTGSEAHFGPTGSSIMALASAVQLRFLGPTGSSILASASAVQLRFLALG